LSVIFSAAAHDWLSRAVGAAGCPLVIEPMDGSTSSSLFRVERTGAPAVERYVLRVLDNREWLADEPDLASHEAAALDEAQRAGLPAPQLIAYADDDVGFGAPVVLMSFIAGRIELQPRNFEGWLAGLAGQLASIHRHGADTFPWRFRSWINQSALLPPSWSAIPHVWERAIAFWLNVGQVGNLSHAVFIHRDYHPTNVLWRGSAVSGVVDWINACRGPAGVDVAHCRTNLVQMYGLEAADRFLDAYLDVAAGFVYDPYWDVDSLLDMCLPQPTYYAPWQHFGLGMIAPDEMRRRVDVYLERVMKRA
jgi:aminoglycoside phosphotransferase (APT) family kinase protein